MRIVILICLISFRATIPVSFKFFFFAFFSFSLFIFFSFDQFSIYYVLLFFCDLFFSFFISSYRHRIYTGTTMSNTTQ